jgi:hypothetical protein
MQTPTLPAVVSAREEPDPNRPPEIDRDYEDIEIEWDLAITNQRNAELRQRNKVKEFFAKVKNIKSVWDGDAREWLAALPHTMRGEAIPLFESNIGGILEDYQLHPSYSWLTQGVNAEDPDIDFYQLSDTELREHQDHLFIPLGRLFVNAANGNEFNERAPRNCSRLTRWTGYEVFIADNLGLWIVFDEHSLASHAPLWYPVLCGLTVDFKHGIARLLPSLSELEHATFENAKVSMKTTHQTGLMVINEVEKSDVKEIEDEAIAQDTAHATGKGKRKLKADVGETPLILAIEKENKNLVKRLLEIGADVNHSNRCGQMPITLAVAKSNVAIIELLLNTDKVNVDLNTREHQTLFEYASQIANSAHRNSISETADFAAGLRGLSTTPMSIAKLAKEHPSYAVLRQLRNYVVKLNLVFNSHKSGYSNRPGKLREFRNTPIIIKLVILTIKGVDPIRKDKPNVEPIHESGSAMASSSAEVDQRLCGDAGVMVEERGIALIVD